MDASWHAAHHAGDRLTSQADPAADAAPVLDTEFLDELASDIGADGVAEAARIFLDDAPPRILRMRDASLQGDAVIRREAHALAGSARSLGLVRLGEAAGALQRAAEAGTADPGALGDLEALLMQSTAALAAWLATCGELA